MYRFVQVTDIHLLDNRLDRLHNIPIYELLVAIINDIKQNEVQYEFVVLSGDLTDNGYKSAYELLCNAMSDLTIPCYWVAGNHDNLDVLQEISANWLLLNNKNFSHKGYHFILLNSVVKDEDGGNKASGKLEESELEFLDTCLSKHTSLPCVVVMHHPPVFSGTWKDDKMLKNFDEFFEIIDKYSNVKIVLYGHQHQAFQIVRNNVIYYTPPAASFQFDKNIKWAFEYSFPGYGIIEINNYNKITCIDKRICFPINPVYEKK